MNPRNPYRLPVAVAVAVAVGALCATLAAAEEPDPSAALAQSIAQLGPAASEAELQKLVALHRDLGAAAAGGGIDCPPESGETIGGGNQEAELARVGREAERNRTLGPLLAKHGLTGRRWAEATFQLVAAGVALWAAEAQDEQARAQGRPAAARQRLLDAHLAARFYVAHRQEIETAYAGVESACGGDGAEDTEDEE